jgi:pyridoxal phosphate-dependent aminotransferase EpsN
MAAAAFFFSDVPILRGNPMSRLYLSPPHLSGRELRFVQEAFDTNWIAPLGPNVEAFEKEFAEAVGSSHAVALSSGTAALHLALILAGVRAGDTVYCSTLTFVASANPILYQDGIPVFIDSDEATWNMDPALLAQELDDAARRHRLPKAVILVHLYGQSADIDPIRAACVRHGVALIEDAAEALGATYRQGKPGAFGQSGIYSFNGNKIITTSGGGMLVSRDAELIRQARFLATQGRDPAPHYEHSRMAFNYRMSNVLAGIGRGQLEVLADRVRQRRRNCDYYREHLGHLPGIRFMPEAPYGQSTRWLTVIRVDPAEFGSTAEQLRVGLEEKDIESRPAWKPMHLQPLFSTCRHVGGKISERIFFEGLCLPSGSAMTDQDRERVVEVIQNAALHPVESRTL